MRYTADNLLVHPSQFPREPGLMLSISPQRAAWQYISFQARRLGRGESWSFKTGENELAFVNLSGRYSVRSNRGHWSNVGGRNDVFQGPGHALYLSRQTEFTVTAEEQGEFAVAWVPTDQDHEPWLRNRLTHSNKTGEPEAHASALSPAAG